MSDEKIATTEISAQQVKALRERTGAGVMDCKRALEEAGGEPERAIEILRKKGAARVARRAGRTAREGLIESYVHLGGRIGVLLELNCETDFVGRTDETQTLARDLAMHIAASNPLSVSREDLNPELVERERRVLREQAEETGKPDHIIEKIVEGRLDRYFQEVCLLEQPFVKDQDRSVEEVLTEVASKVGEKIAVRRFVRFELGQD